MIDKKEVFHSFRKNPKPLPMIKVKIGQYNKDIEKILNKMGNSYDFKNFYKEIKKSEKKLNKKVLNKLALLRKEKTNDKINFGPITYLTYKETQENNSNRTVSKYTFEYLKKKIMNSNNFKVGSYNDGSLSKHNKYNLTDRKTKNDKRKINIEKYFDIEDIEIKNKKNIEINNIKKNDNDNIEDKKDEFLNENYNVLDSTSNSNRNLKPIIDEIRNISNENKKPPMILKLNDDVNYLETDRNNLYSRNSNSQAKNNISLSNRAYSSFQNNNYVNNISKKYTSTNYILNRKKPLDLKEIKLKNKAPHHFTDYNELIKYYKTNNNFLKSIHKTNNQLQSLTMINELFDIEGIEQFHKEKYNYFKKKKRKIKFKDKLIKKNNVKNDSLLDIFSEGKKKMKNEVKANFGKIKKQMNHLFLVDKIEKYSDSIPAQKMKTFNIEYNKQSEKIGISDNCITLKNGKIYHPPESDSKKLNQKISQNCDELFKLTDQILIDRYYFSEKESKCRRLTERVKKEKIDLSTKLLI